MENYSATINCESGMFGRKEITDQITSGIIKVNPEIEILGKPNTLFAMEITKKQCDYYEEN